MHSPSTSEAYSKLQMSSPSPNSSIQRLDFDLLGCIFTMNTDMFDDPGALETTLATSRVCRDWRSFMLDTTSIWARVIDFDHKLWFADEGRHELMRRTGTALLWVKKARCVQWPRHGMDDILTIIGENWARIQGLEVLIEWDFSEQWSQLLSLPAPHLASFGIAFAYRYNSMSKEFKSLFSGAGNAPMLRDFWHFGVHPYSIFHLTAGAASLSWMHHLSSMDLSVELTVSETLQTLMLTQNLINLRLDKMVGVHEVHIYPRASDENFLPLVSLPKLAHLHIGISNALAPVGVLLDHMCIPPSCSMNISAHFIPRGDIDKKKILAPTIQAISTCARPHFAHHIPQQVRLTIKKHYFMFETATYSDKPTFKLWVELSPRQVFLTHTLTMLLNHLSLPGLSQATALRIRISGVNRPVPGFSALMACLPSVNTITTDKLSLRHLRAYSASKGPDPGPRAIFPLLKTLKLLSPKTSPRDRSKFDDVPDPVSKYVLGRIAHGHAISVVDFTANALPPLETQNMAFLKKAVGVKVLWRQRRVAGIHGYICGTDELSSSVSV